jgi:hypothetical protein
METAMAVLNLSDEQTTQFANFLKHRRLNSIAVEHLGQAKKDNDGKPRDLRAGKNLSYAEIANNLIKAVNNGWLALNALVDILDGSELAGKQHVCVYKLPEKDGAKILATLRTPTGTKGATPAISDFFTIPRASHARILVDKADEVVLKVATRRDYWITNLLEEKPNREVFERVKHQERSAVVIKCSLVTGLVQIRIPPREKGPAETAQAVYDFAHKALAAHLPMDEDSWFHNLDKFPVAKAFSKILDNTTDFELWRDTPEDRKTRTQISNKGRPKPGTDLRSQKNWQYGKGYSRTNIRGFWKCASHKVFTHINADKIRLGHNGSREFARIFVPELCDDKDLDHVISRIRDHI